MNNTKAVKKKLYKMINQLTDNETEPATAIDNKAFARSLVNLAADIDREATIIRAQVIDLAGN